MPLDEDRDRLRWNLLSLEEMERRIHLEIVQLRARIEEFEELKTSKEDQLISSLENSGIPQSLYEEYEAFCESLNPQFGQRVEAFLSLVMHLIMDHTSNTIPSS